MLGQHEPVTETDAARHTGRDLEHMQNLRMATQLWIVSHDGALEADHLALFISENRIDGEAHPLVDQTDFAFSREYQDQTLMIGQPVAAA